MTVIGATTRAPRNRNTVQKLYTPGGIEGEDTLLGELRLREPMRDVVDVTVFARRAGRGLKPRIEPKAYVVDSLIEGARLVFRVHGMNNVVVNEFAGSISVKPHGVRAGTERIYDVAGGDSENIPY